MSWRRARDEARNANPIAAQIRATEGPLNAKKSCGTGNGSHGSRISAERKRSTLPRSERRIAAVSASAPRTKSGNHQMGGNNPTRRAVSASVKASAPNENQRATPAHAAAARDIPGLSTPNGLGGRRVRPCRLRPRHIAGMREARLKQRRRRRPKGELHPEARQDIQLSNAKGPPHGGP